MNLQLARHGTAGGASDLHYLSFLDGLRAIAVMSVVFYHLSPALVPNGYLGVDVFFVISGFIVSYSVSNRPRGRFYSFLLDFYARRFVRLLPALIICLLVTVIFIVLFVPESWLSSQLYNTGFAAFFGVSNIVLSSGVDYFSPATEYNAFTHTWSLGVEEQFYIVFPIMFFIWGADSKKKWISPILYSFALITSLIMWFTLSKTNPLNSFYMIYARFWELAIGVLAYQAFAIIMRRRAPLEGKIRRYSVFFATLGLLGLFFAFYYRFSPEHKWIGNFLAVVSTSTIILNIAGRSIEMIPHLKVLRSTPLRTIGLASYSLYLWHWPIFVLARWTVGLSTLFQMCVALALTGVIASLSYLYVETPARHYFSRRSSNRIAVVATGVGAIAIAAFVFNGIYGVKSLVSLSVVERDRDTWIPNVFAASYSDIPDCVITVEQIGPVTSQKREKCGGSSRQSRVFALGDSHTGAYIPLLKRFTLLTGTETLIVSTAGCPFLSFFWHQDNNPSCAEHVQAGWQAVSELAKEGDVIFLSSLRMPRLGEQYYQFSDELAESLTLSEDAAAGRKLSEKLAMKLLAPLAERGVSIVFELPKPVFRSPPFRCSDWFNATNPSCRDGTVIEREFLEKVRAPVIESLNLIKNSIPNVHVWDSFSILCPDARLCSAFHSSGKPLFFDGDHISGFGNLLLTESFVSKINSLLPQ